VVTDLSKYSYLYLSGQQVSNFLLPLDAPVNLRNVTEIGANTLIKGDFQQRF
jgi:hypothetical protein